MFIFPLPVFSVPAMLTPVPVTTTMFALPTALNVMLPFAVAIFTLLFPLLMLDGLPVAFQLKVPLPSVVNTYPAVPPVICTLLTLPNETFDAVEKLALADILIELALIKLPPVKLPPVPLAVMIFPETLMLPPMFVLPEKFAYPATLIPVPVTVNVVFPTAATVTFPFEAPI